MKAKVNRVTVELISGDILTKSADGLVHVTNPMLALDPALQALTGPTILHQLKAIGWCDVAHVVSTDSGSLKSFVKIIHAVAPRWGEGSERGKLANVTWESLKLAEDLHLTSLILPAISVGALGYPVEGCAQIMIERVIDFAFEPVKYLRRIIFCLSTSTIFEIFADELSRQIDDLRQTGEGKIHA
jgi:O-acetyl-ADP-ribose deacetylase